MYASYAENSFYGFKGIQQSYFFKLCKGDAEIVSILSGIKQPDRLTLDRLMNMSDEFSSSAQGFRPNFITSKLNQNEFKVITKVGAFMSNFDGASFCALCCSLFTTNIADCLALMVDVLLGRKNETLYPNTVIRVLKSLADLDESISEALISDFTAYVKLVDNPKSQHFNYYELSEFLLKDEDCPLRKICDNGIQSKIRQASAKSEIIQGRHFSTKTDALEDKHIPNLQILYEKLRTCGSVPIAHLFTEWEQAGLTKEQLYLLLAYGNFTEKHVNWLHLLGLSCYQIKNNIKDALSLLIKISCGMDVGKFVHVYAFLARMSGETSEEKIETAVAYCRLVNDDIDNLWNNGRITEQIGLFTDPRCPPFQ